MTQPANDAQVEPVAVLVNLRAKEGCEEQVKAEIQQLFARIRADEAACRLIVGHQSRDDPRKFMLFEQWDDRAVFEDFRTSRPYMEEYFERMAALVEGGEVGLWDPVA